MQTGLKKCPQCGAMAYMDAQQCQNCGRVYQSTNPSLGQTQAFTAQGPNIPQPQIPRQFSGSPMSTPAGFIQVYPGTHSVFLPILIHFLLCGAGAFYNRQTMKAVVLVGVWIAIGGLFWTSMAFGPNVGPALAMVTMLAAPVYWIATLIDTLMVADKLNKGYQVGHWQFF